MRKKMKKMKDPMENMKEKKKKSQTKAMGKMILLKKGSSDWSQNRFDWL